MGNPNDETHDLRRLNRSLLDTAASSTEEVIRSTTPAACLMQIDQQDPDGGEKFIIGIQGLVIGRDSGCDVLVTDPCVSRRHARIELNPDGRYWVTDLGSCNGTFVNDIRVRNEILEDGSHLRVGDCIFRFLLNGKSDAIVDDTHRKLQGLGSGSAWDNSPMQKS
jgi:pSer/pThr/pTyr-binding forkhead associated (FHA) protein